MIKKFFIILATLIVFHFFQLYQLGKNYDSLVLPMDANTAISKMGKPDWVEFYGDGIFLRYWESPLPANYTLLVKNGKVIDKVENILP